jgi:hypothetical protein
MVTHKQFHAGTPGTPLDYSGTENHCPGTRTQGVPNRPLGRQARRTRIRSVPRGAASCFGKARED